MAIDPLVAELFELVQSRDASERDEVLEGSQFPDHVINRVKKLLRAHSENTAWFNDNFVVDILDKDPTFFGDPELPALGESIESFLKPGETVGEFQIIRKLGMGGMSAVYLAKQQPVDRLVALKLIRSELVNRYSISRFEREMSAQANLSHPNIATFFGTGILNEDSSGEALPEPRMFACIEFFDGVHIDEYCRAKQLGWSDCLKLCLAICDGLQHAHDKGIVHRDVKPGNLLVRDEQDPTLKIIDFGIAKSLGPDSNVLERTLTGHLLGSPRYMSPEQYVGASIDESSDQFSLAVVIWELLTGDAFFESLSRAGQIMEASKPWPKQINLILDSHARNDLGTRQTKRLAAVLQKGLAVEPEKRYPKIGRFGEDLRAIVNDEPISLGDPSWWSRIQSRLNRHREHIAWTAVPVFIALIAALSFWIWQQANDRQQLQQDTNQKIVDMHAANRLILELCAEGNFEENRHRFDTRLIESYERQKLERQQSGSDKKRTSEPTVYWVLAVLYCNESDFWKADTAIELARFEQREDRWAAIARGIYQHFLYEAERQLGNALLPATEKLEWQVARQKCLLELNRPVDFNAMMRTIDTLETEYSKSLLELIAKNVYRLARQKEAVRAADTEFLDGRSGKFNKLAEMMVRTHQKFKYHSELKAHERGNLEYRSLLSWEAFHRHHLVEVEWIEFNANDRQDFGSPGNVAIRLQTGAHDD